MSVETKINTLQSLLPTSIFVQEQISYAIKYAKENEETIEENLDLAIMLAELAKKYSDANFFLFRPILCALLQDVDVEKLEFFNTDINPISVLLAEFAEFRTKFATSTKECANDLAIKAMGKAEILTTVLCWLAKQMETNDKLACTKVAYMMINLRLCGVNLTEDSYEAYNKLLIAIDKAEF